MNVNMLKKGRVIKLPTIVQHLPKTRVAYSRNYYSTNTIFFDNETLFDLIV